MSKSQRPDDQPKPEPEEQAEPRFSREQYDMLLRCSENGKEGITEWNKWRKANLNTPVYLEGANLREAHLEGADLREAHVEGATLWDAHLEGASLWDAHLEGAELVGAHLEGADLREARLEGAKLGGAHLEGAKAVVAVVDGGTLIDTDHVDRETDFTGVGLDGARIDPGLKQLLEYNIRRKRWHEWYGTGMLPTRILKHAFVRPFWLMSDYGRSTKRIIFFFLALAIGFALIYCAWPVACQRWNLPFDRNLVADLYASPKESSLSWAVGVRSLYFSVVTMTTLGFGDMYANKQSFPGHIVLAFQVLLGYVMLGALITRFAVLFTAGGPAAKFAKKEKNKKPQPPANPDDKLDKAP